MDEEHDLSTDVRLALIFYAPNSKNLKVHIVFALFVISFFFFKVARTIVLGKDIKNLI